MHGRIRSLGNEMPGSNSRRKRGRPFQIPEGLRSPRQTATCTVARRRTGGKAAGKARHAGRDPAPSIVSATCFVPAWRLAFRLPAHLRACARSRLRLAPAWPRAAGVGWIVVCVTPGLVPRVGRDVPVPVTCVSDERREGSRPLSPPAALRRHCSRPPEGHQLSYQHKQHGGTPASGWVSTHICP